MSRIFYTIFGFFTSRRQFWAGVLLLLVFSVSIFAYTVAIRKSWFGQLSPERWQSQTAWTVKFARNWYREGALNLGLLMLERPLAVDATVYMARLPYVSYPSGFVVPIYLLSLVGQTEPTVSLVMAYNLFNHWLISLLLGLTAYILVLGIGWRRRVALGFAAVPILLELLLPVSLYFHQNVWFSDQAVILPWTLVIFLEAVSIVWRRPAWLKVIQAMVIIWGLFSDPTLFVFVLLVMLVIGVRRKGVGRSDRTWELAFGAMALASLAAYYWYTVWRTHSLTMLWHKFLVRTAIIDPIKGTDGVHLIDFFNQFWGHWFLQDYGVFALFAIWASLLLVVSLSCYLVIYRGVARELKSICQVAALVTLPPFLQVYVFRHHSIVHEFSVMKFALPLSLVVFVLAPIAVFLLLRETSVGVWPGRRWPGWQKRAPIWLCLACLCLSAAYACKVHGRWRGFFPPPDNRIESIGNFVGRNTDYSDIAFSPDIEIGPYPTLELAYSMKPVVKIDSFFGIWDQIRYLDGNYEINLLLLKDNNQLYVRELIAISYDLMRQGDMVIYKIRSQDFLRYFFAK